MTELPLTPIMASCIGVALVCVGYRERLKGFRMLQRPSVARANVRPRRAVRRA